MPAIVKGAAKNSGNRSATPDRMLRKVTTKTAANKTICEMLTAQSRGAQADNTA